MIYLLTLREDIMAEQMLEFFPELDLHEYADLLDRQESELTEAEKRLTAEAVSSSSDIVDTKNILSTPFITIDVDEEVDVVGVSSSSPPLTTSTASTTYSSRLTHKQVVPKKSIHPPKSTSSSDSDIDLKVTTPHVVVEKKKATKKRQPKAPINDVPLAYPPSTSRALSVIGLWLLNSTARI